METSDGWSIYVSVVIIENVSSSTSHISLGDLNKNSFDTNVHL